MQTDNNDLVRQAKTARKNNDLSLATTILLEVLGRDPANSEALIACAEIAADKEDWVAALKFWSQYSEHHPESIWGPYWTAWVYSQMGDLDGSVKRLLILLNGGFNSQPIHERLVELYLKLGRPNDSLPHFKELDLMPSMSEYRLKQLASWIINGIGHQPGFPIAAFDMDESLLRHVRV